MTEPPDEFAWIDRLSPLTRGDSRALRLLDDAAVIPGRPGHDLVVSKDAMVEGVHFPEGASPDLVARRLLRTNLSDLAAKAAEPFGYFLMTAWPSDRTWADREAFIRGLAEDGEAFGVSLLGGDTVRTPGPLTLSATVLGWTPSGRAVLRSGARPGHAAVVCGPIGDGRLGLLASKGEISDADGSLAAHYYTPRPLLCLRPLLQGLARAAADVSDGLLADSGAIARASGVGVSLDLGRLPLSAGGAAWLSAQPDPASSRLALATGGDDYAVVCAIEAAEVATFVKGAAALGVSAVAIGVFEDAPGVRAAFEGLPLALTELGWRH